MAPSRKGRFGQLMRGNEGDELALGHVDSGFGDMAGSRGSLDFSLTLCLSQSPLRSSRRVSCFHGEEM